VLTILSWFWEQPFCRTKFTAHHVNVWADMVRRNCTLDYRLACVTDKPQGIDKSIDIITPPQAFEGIVPARRWGGRRPNCYRRLSMFRSDAADIFGDRFVSMDLDCVVGRSLDPLFDRPDDLVLFKGTSIDRPYNGSMMLIKAGCRSKVYNDFNQQAATKSGEKFVGSDQAWLAMCLGWGEQTWAEHDGVYWYGSHYKQFIRGRVSPSKGFRKPRLVFFPGKIKPWLLADFRSDKFITDNYRIMEREAEAA
jgi:hypothetical protein